MQSMTVGGSRCQWEAAPTPDVRLRVGGGGCRLLRLALAVAQLGLALTSGGAFGGRAGARALELVDWGCQWQLGWRVSARGLVG